MPSLYDFEKCEFFPMSFFLVSLLLFYHVLQITCQVRCLFQESTWGRFIHPCKNFEGQSCTYSCYSDFDPPSVVSSSTVRCTSSGSWSGNLDCPDPLETQTEPPLPPIISGVPNSIPSNPSFPSVSRPSQGYCPEIVSLPHGTLEGECKRAQDKDVCSFECHRDYSLEGSSHLVCKGGSWSEKPPSCVERSMSECRPLSPPDNGSLMGLCKTPRIGSQCSLVCQLGFRAVGVNPFKCTSQGWTNQDPRCVDIVCSGIKELRNGYLVGDCNPGVVGNFCAFACKKGFALVGPSVTICSYTGSWDPPQLPSCIPLNECNVKVPAVQLLPTPDFAADQISSIQQKPTSGTQTSHITTTRVPSDQSEVDDSYQWEFVDETITTSYPEGRPIKDRGSQVKRRKTRAVKYSLTI